VQLGFMKNQPPIQTNTVHEYLNLCAAVGERLYKAHTLQSEIQSGYKKLEELEKQMLAEQNAAAAMKTSEPKGAKKKA
jgi:hypothetical protein